MSIYERLSNVSWYFNPIPRRPDFNIGGDSNPYLRRWYLLCTPWFRIYLHNMLRDDDDRALHDHPWANVSIVLKGGYWELTHDEDWDTNIWFLRLPGSLTFRKATVAHRLALCNGPSWSLFLTGKKVRLWGFHCPKGWVPWREFVNVDRPGEVGPGCGE